MLKAAATIIAAVLSIASNMAMAGPAEEMMAADKAFSALSVAKGHHVAFLAYMADDVREFSGAHPPILGKAAVAAAYAASEARNGTPKDRLEWTPLEAKASSDGTLGWTRGRWTDTATAKDGKVETATGYYVTLWRRQQDGSYKYELDVGGEDAK